MIVELPVAPFIPCLFIPGAPATILKLLTPLLMLMLHPRWVWPVSIMIVEIHILPLTVLTLPCDWWPVVRSFT